MSAAVSELRAGEAGAPGPAGLPLSGAPL